EYLDYRDHNEVFSGLLAYEPFIEATLAGGKLQRLLGTAATCNYFEVLNEHPAHGRGFVSSDCAAPVENAVVVISDGLWQGTFEGDPSLVGKRILLNRAAFTDRKSTRLNSSHGSISYAVFCLKKKKQQRQNDKQEKHTKPQNDNNDPQQS